MDAIKKQAAKLRDQVAKQQQMVLKHLGHFGSEAAMIDETELQCHQRIENLYNSTRAAKHFQRNVVRGIEGFISTSLKQMEIVRKLSEDCSKYGSENQTTDPGVARAALHFGTSHNMMENERGALLGLLGDQVSEPLRALITGAPLEDARHLTHRYDKLRQEVEAQAADVIRRRSKTRESDISAETCLKLRNAEARLGDLKSTMMALGKEAIAAMLLVEDQQQGITFQCLFTMVDAERTYHQHVIAILDKLYSEVYLLLFLLFYFYHQASLLFCHFLFLSSFFSLKKNSLTFTLQVIHPFDAQAEGELSLSVDDYVVVCKVASHGWSEGECEGNAGWFPSAYVLRQEKAPASKKMD
ncbi:LOW QUALITY PROTEIN: SH3_1 domain-containing protein [Cephalotus follicularis]|uniref:SH3_1 domain-containing protein n=1 Tax=Cephalotus follicularis TaxID=3775 RepID=A0A1Q3DFM4_CEPFO|nr:LOW QUALITY PROTEIN: SH3_1 domain-containing protein [Cephalotus follicularis]